MASRKEQKAKLRQERIEREQAAAAASARRRRTGYVLGGLLAAGALVALIGVVSLGGNGGGSASGKASGGWPSASLPDRKVTDLDAAVKQAGCELRSPKSEGAGHTEKPVKYKTAPPTSGPHFTSPASDKANLAVPKPYESLLHAMEHGRVIMWFKPTAPPAVRGAMKKLYDEDKPLLVLTPNPRPMPYVVAATGWGKLIGCPAYNDRVPDALRAFRDAYRLKGPEYVPNAE